MKPTLTNRQKRDGPPSPPGRRARGFDPLPRGAGEGGLAPEPGASSSPRSLAWCHKPLGTMMLLLN
jgi:hypothetical protein